MLWDFPRLRNSGRLVTESCDRMSVTRWQDVPTFTGGTAADGIDASGGRARDPRLTNSISLFQITQ